MRRILLQIILMTSFFVSAQQTDSIKKLPILQKERVSNIDIKHIAIDLQFDWNKQQAFGTTTILLSPLTATASIKLDAGMLTINSISLQNKELKYQYDGGDKNDNLEIILDRIYNNNEDIVIKIDYHTNHVNTIDPTYLSGTNGKGLRFSQPTSNDPLKLKEIWSFGDPESNRYWFPCYDAPNDLRTTEFTTTVDKNLTVISNGKRSLVKINLDGTKTYHCKSDIPYPNHLTAFVIGEFFDVQESDMENNISYHNYGATSQMDWVAASTARLSDMLNYFSKVLGVKYPYKNYTQVFVQGIGSFNGNHSFSTITENMVDDEGTHADFYYLWDQTEAEALAQQWFANYITAKNWSHVWLNKALARRMQQLYNEQKNGRDEFLLYQLSFDQSVYLGDWNAGYRHPIVTEHYDDIYNFTSDNYPIYSANVVLNMLQKQLGNEKWWKAIQLYTKNNSGKLVTTKDFQAAVNEASGENLDWFFDQWIYKMGHPIFEVTKTYDDIKHQLTINVKQTQSIDKNDEYPQVSYYKGALEIEIDGKIERVWIEPKNENQFTFSLSQKPSFVNFDYESTWMKEIKIENTINELISISKNSKDALARRMAMQKLGSILKEAETQSQDKIKIIAALQNIITSKSYWRLRIDAMAQLRNYYSTNPETIDDKTLTILYNLTKTEKSYLKGAAINFLGITKKEKFTPIYLQALNDPSDRVINLAAIALGKTKSPKAFPAFEKLITKPSMKSQSLLSAFSGLKELGDPRGFDIAYKALANTKLSRWRLPDGSVWDYRIFAAQLISSLGRSKDVFPLIMGRFKESFYENDLEGMLNNVLIINILADERGQEAFDLLKMKYKNDENTFNAISNYEMQFKESLTKNK